MVLVAVGRSVIRLDLTSMVANIAPSEADVQAVADAAVIRYLAATAPKPDEQLGAVAQPASRWSPLPRTPWQRP